MKFKNLRIHINYWLLIIIIFSNCTTTRLIIIEGDSENLQHKVTRKSLNKEVIIYFNDGSQRSGKLKEKTKEGLKIKNQESNKIFEIKYINMKKLEIKERQIPLPIFLGTIGGIVMMYLIVRGYGDAIEGMGK